MFPGMLTHHVGHLLPVGDELVDQLIHLGVDSEALALVRNLGVVLLRRHPRFHDRLRVLANAVAHPAVFVVLLEFLVVIAVTVLIRRKEKERNQKPRC